MDRKLMEYPWFVGSSYVAKKLGVSAGTIRKYYRERLFGIPEKTIFMSMNLNFPFLWHYVKDGYLGVFQSPLWKKSKIDTWIKRYKIDRCPHKEFIPILNATVLQCVQCEGTKSMPELTPEEEKVLDLDYMEYVKREEERKIKEGQE